MWPQGNRRISTNSLSAWWKSQSSTTMSARSCWLWWEFLLSRLEQKAHCPFSTSQLKLFSTSSFYTVRKAHFFGFYFSGQGSVWSWGQLCRSGKIGKSLCHSDGRYGWTNVWDKCSAQTSDCQWSKVNTGASQCNCPFLVCCEFQRRCLIRFSCKISVLCFFFPWSKLCYC